MFTGEGMLPGIIYCTYHVENLVILPLYKYKKYLLVYNCGFLSMLDQLITRCT